MSADLDLLVLADDRTGALETAGACANAGFTVVMTPYGCDDRHLPPHDCRVVDLGSRRLDADEAARRAASIDLRAVRHAHKIDSTLKGNWAAELAGLARRTLLIPAFPAAGRTCVRGVVHVDGVALGRPRDFLDSAGADDVVVADATTDEAISVLIAHWRDDGDLLLAGTAGAIGAGARAIAGARALPAAPITSGPVLVVCGSNQPVSRAQVGALSPEHRVLVGPDGPADPGQVAADLSTRAREIADQFAVVVVIGGDTAAAVLGDRAMLVGGTLEPGVAWSRDAHGGGPLVVTKPGGFGDEQTLVRVLDAVLQR